MNLRNEMSLEKNGVERKNLKAKIPKMGKRGKNPVKNIQKSRNIETGQNERGNRINTQDDKKL